MIKLITFTDENMTISAHECINNALNNNVDYAEIIKLEDLDGRFKKRLRHKERGVGYWLWKPYIIDKELKKLNHGDYLIYMDAGVKLINNIKYITDRMDTDVWLFGNMYEHKHWCKNDIINEIGGDAAGKQVQASVIVLRNSTESRKFIAEWYKFCNITTLIDDSESLTINDIQFKENRHDQAILTQLAKRENKIVHWWPAMYNNGAFVYDKKGYENDNYPVLFLHHRKRNNEY